MEEVQDRETKLPLVVLDAMLPRQVLKIQVHNPREFFSVVVFAIHFLKVNTLAPNFGAFLDLMGVLSCNVCCAHISHISFPIFFQFVSFFFNN